MTLIENPSDLNPGTQFRICEVRGLNVTYGVLMTKGVGPTASFRDGRGITRQKPLTGKEKFVVESAGGVPAYVCSLEPCFV